jgi:hypothetical protein
MRNRKIYLHLAFLVLIASSIYLISYSNYLKDSIKETPGWTSYSNAGLGISFNYPDTWSITKNERSPDGAQTIVHIASPELIAAKKKAMEKQIDYGMITSNIEFTYCQNINFNCPLTSGVWIGKRNYGDLEDFLNHFSTEEVFPLFEKIDETVIAHHQAFMVMDNTMYSLLTIMIDHPNGIYAFSFPNTFAQTVEPDSVEGEVIHSIKFLE